MNKTVKVFSVLMIAVMLVMVASPIVLATQVGNVTIPQGNAGDTQEIAKKAANIVATIRNIAAIAAVIIIAVLGFKYMLGSMEERADYKKSFIPLIVGIVVVLAAVQIAAMLFNFLG